MGMVKPPLDLDALVARIDELVRVHGAVPRGELRTIKRHLPAIAARLVARGLEVGSSIRRPLETQILDLAGQGFVPKKGLERRLAGASSREVQEATRRLVERGALVEVIRESGAGFVAATGDVDVMDAVGPERASSLSDEGREAGAPGAPCARRAADASPRRRERPAGALDRAGLVGRSGSRLEAPLVETLTREIRKRFRENPLPIRIPDLLRAMGTPADAGKRALIDGAARGLFALEPESGMGRLSGEDAELCPAGPDGDAPLLGRGARTDGSSLMAMPGEISLQATPFADEFVDVAALNAHISNHLLERVETVKQAAQAGETVASKAIAVLGPAGGGKTHLFSRLSHQSGSRPTLVLLRPYFGVNVSLRDVLAAVVDQLCLPVHGDDRTQLDVIASHWVPAGDVEEGVRAVVSLLPGVAPAAHLARALLELRGREPSTTWGDLAWLSGREPRTSAEGAVRPRRGRRPSRAADRRRAGGSGGAGRPHVRPAREPGG